MRPLPLSFGVTVLSISGLVGRQSSIVDAIDILPGAREAFPLPSVIRSIQEDPQSKSLA